MAANGVPRPSADVRAGASTLVQYALAYGVGVPVFVLHKIGRRLRLRKEPALPPNPP